METLVLCLFLGGIAACVALGLDMLWALGFGVLCFGGYALWKGCTVGQTLGYMWEGLSRLGNLLAIFVLIGAMTGLWRRCGTISYIVCSAVKWIDPRFFVFWSFLLCALMSLLVGSSLCTASIMGLVLVLITKLSGAAVLPVAGAVLAGANVGDRCSPMSSSANLVCSATGTELYGNVKNMLRSCLVPLALTVAIYLLFPGEGNREAESAMSAGVAAGFSLNWTLALPAAAIILLCLCRVNVRLAMGVSLALSFLLGLLVQHASAPDLLRSALLGFTPAAEQSTALAGGGVISMAHVFGIIALSSTYLGIFRATGLSASLEKPLRFLAARVSPHTAAVLVGIPVAMISCSQSLAIMLLGQIGTPCFERREDAALAVEDSVVLYSSLIPWSTANAALCAAMGVSSRAAFFAVYLYLLPLLNALWHTFRFRRRLPARRGSGAAT